jgi:hypothetical protein
VFGLANDLQFRISTMCHVYRLLRWELPEGEDPHRLELRSDEEALVTLSDVGLQLAVSFSEAGSLLATGGEVNECPVTYFFIE